MGAKYSLIVMSKASDGVFCITFDLKCIFELNIDLGLFRILSRSTKTSLVIDLVAIGKDL